MDDPNAYAVAFSKEEGVERVTELQERIKRAFHLAVLLSELTGRLDEVNARLRPQPTDTGATADKTEPVGEIAQLDDALDRIHATTEQLSKGMNRLEAVV